MYIRGKGEVFLVDRDNSVFSCSSLSFPARAEEEHLVDTLLDGVSRTNCMISSSAILSGQELVEDKLPNGVRPRYLVYDTMQLSGKPDISRCDHATRLQCIQSEIILPRDGAVSS